MEDAVKDERITKDQAHRISQDVDRERSRLRNFIRKRVQNEPDVDDILQDVFYELVEMYRLMKPVEQVTAWMFRVARNRITDLFRNRPETTPPPRGGENQAEWQEFLPSPDAGPEAAYARSVLLEELEEALDELPEEQREVFVAHELEGLSFKEIAANTGVPVNTLLSRKRYAVLYLRRRLQDIYDQV
jgi:RNA polymerase sigma factor (sigma-70 family)